MQSGSLAFFGPRFHFSRLVPLALSTMAEPKGNDTGLAEFGRRELSLTEHEMLGLMAWRQDLRPAQPMKGLIVNGSLHATIQTGELLETLQALGAKVLVHVSISLDATKWTRKAKNCKAVSEETTTSGLKLKEKVTKSDSVNGCL